jgi:magnesium chelatase subunit H
VLIRMTRLGKFNLQKKEEAGEPSGLAQWARKFRPKSGHGEGQRQLAMLRNLGKVLQHIPGKARDLSTYITVHQYWMHSSPENLRRMLAMLVERYVPGYAGRLKTQPPIEYPDLALFHPDAPAPFADLAAYQRWRKSHGPRRKGQPRGAALAPVGDRGVVGLLSLRTVALSGNTAHLDALTRALEARGLEVRLAYSAGLDFRPRTTDQGRQSSAGGGTRSAAGRRPSPVARRWMCSSTVPVSRLWAGWPRAGPRRRSRR